MVNLAGSPDQRFHGCEQVNRAFEVFGAGDSKVDPPGVKAVGHLDVGAGTVRRHPMFCQGVDPGLPRNGNAGDRPTESVSLNFTKIEVKSTPLAGR